MGVANQKDARKPLINKGCPAFCIFAVYCDFTFLVQNKKFCYSIASFNFVYHICSTKKEDYFLTHIAGQTDMCL